MLHKVVDIVEQSGMMVGAFVGYGDDGVVDDDDDDDDDHDHAAYKPFAGDDKVKWWNPVVAVR